MFRKIAIFLLFVLSVGMPGQTINNGISLFVTKANQWDAHLEWTCALPKPLPYVYKVYRSEDPTLLGNKIANVNGTATGGSYDDIGVLQDGFTYYYQIVHVSE